MDNLAPDELRKRYEDLMVDQDRIEFYKDEVLSTGDFVAVVRSAMKAYLRTMELAKVLVPRNAGDFVADPEAALHVLQLRSQFTWSEMIGFLDELYANPASNQASTVSNFPSGTLPSA